MLLSGGLAWKGFGVTGRRARSHRRGISAYPTLVRDRSTRHRRCATGCIVGSGTSAPGERRTPRVTADHQRATVPPRPDASPDARPRPAAASRPGSSAASLARPCAPCLPGGMSDAAQRRGRAETGQYGPASTSVWMVRCTLSSRGRDPALVRARRLLRRASCCSRITSSRRRLAWSGSRDWTDRQPSAARTVPAPRLPPGVAWSNGKPDSSTTRRLMTGALPAGAARASRTASTTDADMVRVCGTRRARTYRRADQAYRARRASARGQKPMPPRNPRPAVSRAGARAATRRPAPTAPAAPRQTTASVQSRYVLDACCWHLGATRLAEPRAPPPTGAGRTHPRRIQLAPDNYARTARAGAALESRRPA